jgi:UDP-glucose 4-epimerase
MKILVTGGMGFIGRHLVIHLLKKGNKITIFDNFSNSDKKSIINLQNEGVNVIEGDITESDKILNAAKDQDIVIHLAAKISVDESIKNPTETFRINVNGTKNVLESCKKNNVKKIIVASSAAVYGEGFPKIKLNENMKTNPISPYGKSKLIMEQEIKKIISKYDDMNCIILRFFNIFGIGQSFEYAGVITKFIKEISMNKPVKIFGDGMQTRDFVSIHDIVESVNAAIKNGKNGTYNIASGKAITINKLAEFMISLSGKNLEIHHISEKHGDIRHSEADISLAREKIGYLPKLKLDEIKKFM